MGSRRHRSRLRLLELIERHGPISRAELARMTRLSLPSVSEIVDELVQLKLVIWVGEGDSTGGRPPRLLRFNAERGVTLAADLSGQSAALGAFLLDGTMLEKTEVGYSSGQDAMTTLIEAAGALCRRMRDRGYEVLAMGVAAPGVTDPVEGKVSFAPAVGWWETPVRAQLESALAIPVVVDNDVNAAALAEWLYGDGGGWRTFAVVLIGTGVGMGIVLDGRIHRGHRFRAGEIGYMWIEEHSRAGETGKGNFESYLSITALAHDYRELLQRGSSSVPESDRTVIEGLVARLEAGDDETLAFMEPRVEALAKALVNVYLVLAPEVIYLAGPQTALFHAVLPLLREKVKSISPLYPELQVSTLRETAGLIGAAALASVQAKRRLTEVELGTEVDARAQLL